MARVRQWVLRVAYPGMATFMYGTIECEREEAVQREFELAWAKISPHRPPAIQQAFPGMLVFVPEDGQ